MKTSQIFQKARLLLAVAVISTTLSAGIYKSEPCPKSKFNIEARLVNAKQANNSGQITFTFTHPTFGQGVQTVNINYGRNKKQIKTDVKGIYKLTLKPGNYTFTISQYGCATIKQAVQIKNKEQLSVKITWALQDPKVKCG